MSQILGSLRGQKVGMVHSNIYTLLVTLLHCAGSTEEPHRIRESGDNKSVGFKAIVSSFIVGEIYTYILTFSRYPVVQGSLGIVWTLTY